MLDPGNSSHTVAMADDAKYFVDNSSTVNTAPHSVLYDRAGATDIDLENHGHLRFDGRRFPHARNISG